MEAFCNVKIIKAFSRTHFPIVQKKLICSTVYYCIRDELKSVAVISVYQKDNAVDKLL